MKMIEKTDLILGSEGSRQCCRINFSLLNANKHRVNMLYYVHRFSGCKSQVCTNMKNSLAAAFNCMERNGSTGCGNEIWTGKSDNPSAKTCQRQSFPFCLLGVLNRKKIK